MEGRNFFIRLLHFLKLVAIVVWLEMVVVGLICWLGGWRTMTHYSNGMFFAGLIALIIGGYSLMGNYNARGSFGYQYPRSAGADTIQERMIKDMRLTDSSLNFSLFMLLIGAISILISAIISGIPV